MKTLLNALRNSRYTVLDIVMLISLLWSVAYIGLWIGQHNKLLKDCQQKYPQAIHCELIAIPVEEQGDKG